MSAYAHASAGTTIIVEPGTYHEELDLTSNGTATNPITIEAATAGTAILDGSSSYATGIYGTGEYNTIVGMVVQHYQTTGYQNEEAAVRTATGWQLISDVVQNNSGTGIGVFGSNITITNVVTQNNGTNGIGGSGATNVTLTNVTSSGNNTGAVFPNHDPTDEGGGGKWALCNGLTFINYHGDNNCGPGLWLDWENSNVTITNSEGSGNHGGGPTNAPDWVGAPLMIEANYGPIKVTNFNASATNSGAFGIFETPGVTVTQSSLMSGLNFRDIDRGVAALVDNNDVVTNNTIMGIWLTDATPTNLTLDYNNYQAPSGYAFFQWTNGVTYSTLASLQQATGFEMHGTLAYV